MHRTKYNQMPNRSRPSSSNIAEQSQPATFKLSARSRALTHEVYAEADEEKPRCGYPGPCIVRVLRYWQRNAMCVTFATLACPGLRS